MENIREIDFDDVEDDGERYDVTQELVDFGKLRLKAQKRAIEDKLTSYYKKMIDEEQYQVFSVGASLILKTVHDLKTQTDNILDVKNGKNEYCFFTVNFKPEFDNKFDDIQAMFETWVNKCKFTKDDYMYSMEQRSETSGEHTGLHVHILFKKFESSPSKIQRAFNKQFFDNFVGTKACLDYKYIADPTKKIKYIMGVKEKKKMPKVYIDREMKSRLQDYWYNTQGYQTQIDEVFNSSEYKKLFSDHIINAICPKNVS